VQLLLQWSNKYYVLWVCVCSRNYPACNARAPYCHLWPARLDSIFHITITHKICVLICSTTLSGTFLIIRRTERDIKVKCTLVQALRLCTGEGLASRPGRILPPGKTRYPLYRRMGGPQGRSEHVRKISPPLGFYPRTVQAVATELSGPLNEIWS
jgi:hypothetical protein